MRALRWLVGGVPCAIGAGVLVYGCGDYIGECDYGACVAPDGGVEGGVDAASDSRSDAPPHPDAAGDGANGSDASDAGDGAVQEDAPAESGVSCDGAAALVCSGECVDPTDPGHCGSCTNACAAPPSGNGQATCSASAEAGAPACGIACNSGYHACNGDCLANTDDPSMDACVLTEAFGVFVSPGGSDGAGCGTRAMACATIGHAMDVAKTMSLGRVYACGSAGSYTENLVVGTSPNRDGLSVYGGLDCSNLSMWTYNANDVAAVAPTAAGYALAVNGLATGVTFEDFGFTALPGGNPGDSSIAVFVANATGTVLLKRVSATAGAGVAGTNQTQPLPYSSAAPTGSAGGALGGGLVTPNSACTSSTGGGGGTPTLNGQDGTDGTPGGSNKGLASAGSCGSGSTGGNGTSGSGGSVGTGASAWATLNAGGWMPAAGGGGGTGTVGQGGGGGASVDATGGGGGGGAGGCGGVGGGGGTGGGSSIAVLAFSSAVDLEACTLTAKNGAGGGAGAAGQTGQTGGGHGNGSGGSACSGGKGGNGGNGGGGGGGAGGVSAGVVWLGSAPTINGTSTPTAATLPGVMVGGAGPAGTGATAPQDGIAGVAAAVVQFQ